MVLMDGMGISMDKGIGMAIGTGIGIGIRNPAPNNPMHQHISTLPSLLFLWRFIVSYPLIPSSRIMGAGLLVLGTGYCGIGEAE